MEDCGLTNEGSLTLTFADITVLWVGAVSTGLARVALQTRTAKVIHFILAQSVLAGPSMLK